MEPMDFSALYMQYRETDRDCALLHYRLQNHKPYEKELFLPTKETMEAAWKEWKSLKERVESLEEPDQVFALVKNHLREFLCRIRKKIRKGSFWAFSMSCRG